MLYWLLYEKLFPFFHPFRIFRYLTFRTAFASLTALLIALFIGPYVIQKLREFQIGQFVRDDGPQSHLKKTGTPTMGGVLICIAILLPTVLWSDPANPFVWIDGFFHAGVRRHRLCRRLHQSRAAAQPGIDGAGQAAVARACRSAGGRGARGAGPVQDVFHAAVGAIYQKPVAPICCGTPGPALFRIWRCSLSSLLCSGLSFGSWALRTPST